MSLCYTASTCLYFSSHGIGVLTGLNTRTGNRTYVGYLYTEVTYNNSVVRVFVQLLQDTVVRKRRVSRGGILTSRGTNIVSSPTLTQGG